MLAEAGIGGGAILGGVYGAVFYQAMFDGEMGALFRGLSVVVALVFGWAFMKRDSESD